MICVICWSSDPTNPLDVCNATVGDLLGFAAQRHPVALLVVQVVVVASVVLSAGVAASAALVAWRQRLSGRLREQEFAAQVAHAQARSRARGPRVYPVRCTSAADTVRLRRGAGGELELDES